MCFQVPSFDAGNSPADGSWPPKRPSLEKTPVPSVPASVVDTRISTIAALPGERHRESSAVAGELTLLLERKDRHLIDVSNFFGEDGEESSPQMIATQLFSPQQMRDILLKQALGRVDKENAVRASDDESGVNPWSSKFTDLFWSKVATRMTNWSNYFVCELTKTPKNNFEFGACSGVLFCQPHLFSVYKN